MNKTPLITLFLSSLVSSQLLSFPQQAIAESDRQNLVPSTSNDTNTVVAQTMNQLTEEKVLEIMETIKKAEAEEDIDTILNFLAPFVTSSITVESRKTTITRNLEGKQAHRDFLEQSFQRVTEREEIDSYTTVTMSEDEQVLTVTRMAIEEKKTEDSKEFLSSSTDLIRFALIDDKPMIVSITITGWLEERP